jgi:hypothetical protein
VLAKEIHENMPQNKNAISTKNLFWVEEVFEDLKGYIKVGV